MSFIILEFVCKIAICVSSYKFLNIYLCMSSPILGIDQVKFRSQLFSEK
ncbi:hypothetical protein LEP1GSC072_4112 [Leptospira noguchii str. Bonito]|nr:hypothetical protein LEP1GSC072_4112 [Leptospira noguchii str. Bonito]